MQTDILTQLTEINAGGSITSTIVGKELRVTIMGVSPNYAGVEIDVAGLIASMPYDLISVTFSLIGGTAGNTTQPSVGEVTGFAQGDDFDRYKVSTPIVLGSDRQVDVLRPLPCNSDGLGQLYIRGAAPAVADSTLSWRVDLRLNGAA